MKFCKLPQEYFKFNQSKLTLKLQKFQIKLDKIKKKKKKRKFVAAVKG